MSSSAKVAVEVSSSFVPVLPKPIVYCKLAPVREVSSKPNK